MPLLKSKNQMKTTNRTAAKGTTAPPDQAEPAAPKTIRELWDSLGPGWLRRPFSEFVRMLDDPTADIDAFFEPPPLGIIGQRMMKKIEQSEREKRRQNDQKTTEVRLKI